MEDKADKIPSPRVNQQSLNDFIEVNRRSTDDYVAGRRLDIEQIRNLILQIGIISFGAVGFSGPLLVGNIIKNKNSFLFGLFLFVFSAILGLFYSAFIIENSMILSLEDYKKGNRRNRKFINLERDFAEKRVTETEYHIKKRFLIDSLMEEPQLNELRYQRSKFLYFLIPLLALGAISIFLSFFEVTVKW